MNYTFDGVNEFIHLSFAVITKNNVSQQNKCGTALANRYYYYTLNMQLRSRDFSRATKLIVYKTLILQVLLYGAESWTLLSTDVAVLRVS